MELTGKMEEFMNDLIGEIMEQAYHEKDGQQYDPFNERWIEAGRSDSSHAGYIDGVIIVKGMVQ